MNKGDFLLIEFTGRIAVTGEIFDLTSAEEAKKAGIYREGGRYKPALVIMGGETVLPGVESQLETMNIGEERTFDVPCDRAFGQRKAALIKVVSVQKFFEKNISPVPGMVVDIDGLPVKVASVSGGRVRLDFNHLLAGKDLRYRVKVLRKLDRPAEKAQALAEHLGLDATAAVAEGKVTIETGTPLDAGMQAAVTAAFKKWLPALGTAFAVKKSGI